MTITSATDGRKVRGDQSRARVLSIAADLATVDGIEGLSIASLAEQASLSKAGVAGLFGSKLQLQLATIEAAREIYIEQVTGPALKVPGGIDRILAMADAALDYSQERIFTGGCFFSATTAELNSRPGPLRDAVNAAMAEWYGFVRYTVQRAIDRGELTGDADQLAFEIAAVIDSANHRSLQGGGAEPYVRARASVRRLLGLPYPASAS